MAQRFKDMKINCASVSTPRWPFRGREALGCSVTLMDAVCGTSLITLTSSVSQTSLKHTAQTVSTVLCISN
uniref:Uncharacterized protein n=1 Tax=Anguilla anguilla TaxID=7936 RepID=A0A0E9XT00_ANGAN